MAGASSASHGLLCHVLSFLFLFHCVQASHGFAGAIFQSNHADGELLSTGHLRFPLHLPSHAEDGSIRPSCKGSLSPFLDGHRPTLVPSVVPSPQRPSRSPLCPLRALLHPPRNPPRVKRELSGSHRGAIFTSISIRIARASRACFAPVRTFCDVVAACGRHVGAPWTSTA